MDSSEPKNCKSFVAGCISGHQISLATETFINNFDESLSKLNSDFDKVVHGDFKIDLSAGRRNAISSQKRLLKGITVIHYLKQVIKSPQWSPIYSGQRHTRKRAAHLEKN